MSNVIEYKNYRISKMDDRNWEVTCREAVTAARDYKDKSGNVVTKAGDVVDRERTVGYGGHVGEGLSVMIRDLAGRGCTSIKELADQISQIHEDLNGLVSSKRI